MCVYVCVCVCVCVCSGGLVAKSCLTLVIPWIADYQVPLPMGFPRPEYWSVLCRCRPDSFFCTPELTQ